MQENVLSIVRGSNIEILVQLIIFIICQNCVICVHFHFFGLQVHHMSDFNWKYLSMYRQVLVHAVVSNFMRSMTPATHKETVADVRTT
jgi:hypothetical protein